MNIEVKGHSGCDIEVVRQDGKLFVFKHSTDPQYSDRLVSQAEKQREASLPEFQHIRVPRIHQIERSEKGTVSVKMDYVYSRNFVEFFEHAGFEQVRYLVDALKMYIDHEVKNSDLTTVSHDVIIEKFADVRKKTLANPALAGLNEVKEIIEHSRRIFVDLPDLTIPVGTCHGDLTFSNILFNGNNYYLIDFLDSFIESPLLDIVKLRQDTRWLWSRLMYSQPCDNIRLKIAFGRIDEELDAYFAEKYVWYKKYYAPLQLMNFLRVLQYAHEQNVIDYLISTLNEQLKAF